MPDRIELPSSLLKTLRFLFPTLDFDRVAFFEGIPWPICLGNLEGIAIPAPLSTGMAHVYLTASSYLPDSEESFLLLAHELVHVLQIQRSLTKGYGLGLANPGVVSYLTCWLSSGFSSGRANRFEREAYDYANGLADGPHIQKVTALGGSWECVAQRGGLVGAVLGLGLGWLLGELLGGAALGGIVGAVLGFAMGIANAITALVLSVVLGIVGAIIFLATPSGWAALRR